jgi:hypothetical protein
MHLMVKALCVESSLALVHEIVYLRLRQRRW